MQYEGTLRNYVQKADINYDIGYCAIIRQDWLKN
jgi:hypothetical protein